MSSAGVAEAVPAVGAGRSAAEEARTKALDDYKRLVKDYADKERKVKECKLHPAPQPSC